jgi:choline dehydrogenase
MAYVRGDKAQFDAWEDFGNPGWNWKELLAYYKKHESMLLPEPWQTECGASIKTENHGFNGHVHVGFGISRQNSSFFERVRQTWKGLGQVVNVDVNSGSTRGSSICPQTMDPKAKRRWDAATAYL